MKNGSPEELDFAYDDEFAVFAMARSKRAHPRRSGRPSRKRVRQVKGSRKAN